MKRIVIAAVLGGLCMASEAAAAVSYRQTVKLSKGKATVAFTAEAPEAKASGPTRSPRVGISPSPNPSFGNFLAQKLDDAGKVTVVPASRVQGAASLSGGYEQLMRSELAAVVSSACRGSNLNYLLVMGAAQMSYKTDITTYIVGLGRMRMRHTQMSRLYDCRSKQVVWQQSVMFETSQGAMSSALSGNGMGALLGGPEAEQAMAGMYAEKLTADLGW